MNNIKLILIAVLLCGSIFRVYAQGTVKASGLAHSDDLFVPCDQEIMASFPGGKVKFDQYLMKNIHYPKAAIKSNVQGKVILDFIIEKDGSINVVKVVKSASPELDVEAIRVLKASPRWRPTKNCGKTERIRFSLRIDFQIPKTKKPQSN